MTERGKFIALEGIDGCGKTTQVDLLADWLPSSGLMPTTANLVITREPGGTQLGQALREILLNSTDDNQPAPMTELLLFMADRAQHVAKVIKPALDRGDWVLCDRYHGSTVAYQGYGRGHYKENIAALMGISTGNLFPDLILCIDVSIATSIQRRKHKDSDRFDEEDHGFLERVNHGFHQLCQPNSATYASPTHAAAWFKVNGEGSTEDVFARCKAVLAGIPSS
jgi:dTMP kinase